MASYNKTFTFTSNSENWFSGVQSSDLSAYWDNTDGNPSAGCLDSRVDGRNKKGYAFWQWTGTWEDLGVTPGATITGISGSYDWRCYEWWPDDDLCL